MLSSHYTHFIWVYAIVELLVAFPPPPNNLSSLEVAQFEKGQKKHSSHPTKSSFIEEINEKYA